MNPRRPYDESDRPAQILLVEDDPGDVVMTRASLAGSATAHQLSVVDDGDQALDFLYRRQGYADAPRPDLVLLDLNLPGVSGHEVLAELKGDPSLAAIPVVVLSTSSAGADIAASYDLHANAYVTKPADLAEFRRAVRSIEAFFLTVARLPGWHPT